MKLTIGVMGSGGGELSDGVRASAYRPGEAIAARDAVIMTGGCDGFPYDDDPKQLIERLIEYYRTKHFRKPSCFCDSRVEG